MEFEDILYEVRNGVAWITINRPDKMNAFRGQTCDEIIKALNKAGYDRNVGAIVLAGAGDQAFCTGGDQSAHDGNYDGRGTIGLPMEELHTAIRDVPKPVIARVQGFAIGGGNVLCTICDLTICSEKADLRPGRPEDGLGRPGLRHRLPGARGRREEGARDLVPEQALLGRRGRGDGPGQRLRAARPARRRGAEVGRGRSASAARPRIAIAKRSFNMDTAHQSGIAGLGMYALKLYYDTEESREGVNALKEKRKPDFRKYAK